MFVHKRFAGNMRRKRRDNPGAPVKCEACPRKTTTPRKGMCWPCYFRDYRGHHIRGPCALCGEEDPRVLRRHVFSDGDSVLCANHAAIAGRRKMTLPELQAECYPPGDRRQRGRRRYDRRTAVRRERLSDTWLLGSETELRKTGRRTADEPAAAD